MLTLLILYLIAGSLLIALSAPLLLQKIPPNSLYGFRLAPVFDSEEIWYATNKYAAKWLMTAGATILVAAIVLFFVPGITSDQYALTCLAAVVAVLGPGLFLSLRYARRIAARSK
jgi:uncharacterized membrane protein